MGKIVLFLIGRVTHPYEYGTIFSKNVDVFKCVTKFETILMQFWLHIWIQQGQKHTNKTLFCGKWLKGICGSPIYERICIQKHEQMLGQLRKHERFVESLGMALLSADFPVELIITST